MSTGTARAAPDVEVAVIGAGFSGICAGIKLSEAGIDDFAILERSDDVGGCWRDNTYPGIAVDINSFSYSFSFEPNPGWSRTFAPGEELWQYALDLVAKYGLRPRIRFQTRVERASFDAEQHLWRLELSGGRSLTARFVLSGTGILKDTKLPAIDGVERFGGKTMHTAGWDHDYDLTGERVAVIGTGASSVQLVPEIAPIVEQLHVFQRTPIWVLPRPDYPIPWPVRMLFRAVPPTQRAVRAVSGAASEAVLTLGAVYNRQLPFLTATVEAAGRAYLRSQVSDPAVREKLTPHYGFGCKRPVVASRYFKTFNRDNVELVTEPITRITKTGIRTADGALRRVDTLVLATGFRVFERGNLPGFETYGTGGMELGAFWDEHRYQAYEGATVPGFPNFFLLVGPYSQGGSSYLAVIETHVRHALRAITEARRRRATWVEVRRDVHDRYFEQVLGRMRSTVFFNNNCAAANSYYFDRRGDAPGLRPGTGLEMWWRSGHYDLEDYAYRAVG